MAEEEDAALTEKEKQAIRVSIAFSVFAEKETHLYVDLGTVFWWRA